MTVPAYQLWHCGVCDGELEEGKFELRCTVDGARFTYSGEPIDENEDEDGPA